MGLALATRYTCPPTVPHASNTAAAPAINSVPIGELILSPEISLTGGLSRRGNVILEVSDNGPGVPDDLTKKIFVPFFTTKEQGSGVGLALARQVMTAHGGLIRLGRAKQGGAKFTLMF